MGTLGVVVSPSEVQSTYNQSDRLKVGLTFILKLLCCQFSGCQTLVGKEKRKAILRCTWEGWCHSGTPPYQGARRRPVLDESLTSLFATAPAPRCSPLQNDYLPTSLVFFWWTNSQCSPWHTSALSAKPRGQVASSSQPLTR